MYFNIDTVRYELCNEFLSPPITSGENLSSSFRISLVLRKTILIPLKGAFFSAQQRKYHFSFARYEPATSSIESSSSSLAKCHPDRRTNRLAEEKRSTMTLQMHVVAIKPQHHCYGWDF